MLVLSPPREQRSLLTAEPALEPPVDNIFLKGMWQVDLEFEDSLHYSRFRASLGYTGKPYYKQVYPQFQF